MYKQKKYKKILIVTAGRINMNDTANNGLLLRNLFRSWPKDKIAQVFNSGDNGDKGFYSDYYQLGENDRRFGKFYTKIHKEGVTLTLQEDKPLLKSRHFFSAVIPFFKRLFIDTGLFELVFVPKLSDRLKQWLNHFNPDLIFVQGYSITFSELSLLIKSYTNAKLVFFATDDWPTYLYNGNFGEQKLLSLIPRWKVKEIVKKMMLEVDIPIAFGYPMQEEYTKRYGKQFLAVIHSDDPLRFDKVEPVRLTDNDTLSIVTIGTFNKYRWPLLQDFERCCEELKASGIKAKVTVVSDAIDPEGVKLINSMVHIEIHRDPGSTRLPALLKGADLLLLIEGFDENFAKSIKLSISTKAHLYMFSKVPILLYSHPNTGIVNYAKKFGWAYVVTDRNIVHLTGVLKNICLDKKLREQLIQTGYKVAMENHDVNMIERKLFHILIADC